MIDFIEALVIIALAVAMILLGVATLRKIPKGEVETLSRTSARIIDRKNEPVGFWITIFNGALWLLFGIFLLTIMLVGMFIFL